MDLPQAPAPGNLGPLVDRLLHRGLSENASDLHVEPRRERARVRFRIDGVLVERRAYPLEQHHGIVSRIKVLAKLDISERRLPQDGAFEFMFRNEVVKLRVSTFPTEFGEKVVMRVANRASNAIGLGRLGLMHEDVVRLREIVAGTHGIVLVVGPTGSGKTSTLYSLIAERESTAVNIVTLEDPIETRFEQVIQAQTNPKVGFTFAVGLRAILRQDPDVVMVGEMRDFETADVAFKAALTGHLVLSSLHTSTAVETVVRLIDVGLERFVVATALRAIVCQRLVRRLCTTCRQPAFLDAAERELLGVPERGGSAIYKAKGCPHCNDTGYSGRTGIFEIIEVGAELSDLLKDAATTRTRLEEFLNHAGVTRLRDRGFELVREGVTSLDEVIRVT